MQLASYCDLPGFTKFDPIGLTFKTKATDGTVKFYFWTPHPNGQDYTMFVWRGDTQTWRQLKKPPSDNRLANLRAAWQAQTDIGLWISTSKRLMNQKFAGKNEKRKAA